ncbi:hypothetical protein FACS189434_01860 [Bacteroidia bacterium]|nr:hypothetical protein FACS189434_01860 [Bacteroidia bacterium]
MGNINYFGITKDFQPKLLFSCGIEEIQKKEKEFEHNNFAFVIKVEERTAQPMLVTYTFNTFTILDSNFLPLTFHYGDFELNPTIVESWICQGQGSMSKTFLIYEFSNIYTMEKLELHSKKKCVLTNQLLHELKMLNKFGLSDVVKEQLNDFKILSRI